MSDPQFSEALLKLSKEQSDRQASHIKQLYNTQRVKAWPDLTAQLGVTVPPNYATMPFNYAAVSAFAMFWQATFKERLAADENKAKESAKAVVNKNVMTFGGITLYPEQQGVFDLIVKNLIEGKHKGALQDGHTGSGKMYIGTTLIAEYVKRGIHKKAENLLRLHPFLIICPNGLMEKWKRTLEAAGLSDLVAKRKIYVISNSAFSHAEGNLFLKEDTDFTTGETTLKWNMFATPILTIVDECQFHIKPSSMRYKAIKALIRAPQPTKTLFMSATPAEKVNDARIYLLAFDDIFLGERVKDDESFDKFAYKITDEPNKPNLAAAKRLRAAIASHIFSIPYVRPKHKAINTVRLVDFENERAKKNYDGAHERYLEAKRKVGENVDAGRFALGIELNNFRRVVEPLRAPDMARMAAANFKEGKYATAIGTAYKETIAECVFQLNDKYGIARDQISVVWGGRKEYKQTELLTREEILNLASSPADYMKKIRGNPQLVKRVKLTLRYLEEQRFYEETNEEQRYRHARLKAMRLTGNQSMNTRQIEIDRFQSGETRIVLFTIATGGVGLSFDQDKPFLLPRMGLFTPVYSGKEFAQLLGRLNRRSSLSDSPQHICMMRGTVEEWHVAPILDSKLKSIGEITNRSTDFVDLLSKEGPKQEVKLRDTTQAEKDAEIDEVSVADINNDTVEDEEDEDELAPV